MLDRTDSGKGGNRFLPPNPCPCCGVGGAPWHRRDGEGLGGGLGSCSRVKGLTGGGVRWLPWQGSRSLRQLLLIATQVLATWKSWRQRTG